jgi:hypothetical protein
MGSEHGLPAHGATNAPAPVEATKVTPERAEHIEPITVLPGLAAPLRRSVDDPLGGSAVDTATRRELGRAVGAPLETGLRRSMESELGAELGDVRVHTDAKAARLAHDLQASAFTHGSDVFFGAGSFDTGTPQGQHLLAHELTHVAQQKQGRDPGPSTGDGTTVGRADDPLEAEADATADRVVSALRRQTTHHGCGCGEHR